MSNDISNSENEAKVVSNPADNEKVVGKANEAKKKMSTLQKIRLIVSTVLAVFLIIFVVQNSNKVEIEFLNINKRIPIVIVMLFSLLTGSLITYLLMKFRSSKKKRK